MAVTRRSDLGDTTYRKGLLHDGFRAVFTEALRVPRPQFWQELVTVVPSDNYEERFESVGNIKNAEDVAEGEAIGTDQVSWLYTTSIVPTKHGNGFEATEEAIEDSKGGFVNMTRATQLLASLVTKKEKHVADTYYAGFAATGADGVYVFHASHPLEKSASLNDNLASGAISPDNLKSAINHFNTIYDQSGRIMFTAPTHLVLHKDYQFTIAEILQSALIAFELSNTKNVISAVSPMRVVLNPYLYKSGAVSPWYLLDKNLTGSGCMFVKRKGYTLRTKFEEANQVYSFYAYERYKAGFVAPGYGIVASPGS